MTIFNLGSINIDYIYTLPHLVTAGETLAATSFQAALGGKGANQSIALARAGADVRHAGRIHVGDDSWLGAMRAAGVDCSHILAGDTATGHAIVAVDTATAENQIILSQPVTNTDDEAKATLEIAKEHGFKRFLLVTSSFHMFRAKLIFDSYGLSVLPYPCGSKALSKTSTWLDYIPNAGALDSTSRALREYLGRIYYRIKLSYT